MNGHGYCEDCGRSEPVTYVTFAYADICTKFGERVTLCLI